MPPSDAKSSPPPRKPKRSGRRTWLFRLAAVTLFPLLFLLALDLLLLAVGFGYPTRFFLRGDVAGEKVYIENIDFGRTYFPSGVERAPMPVSFPVKKPSDEYRIFVLGESAAMGFPDPSYSFSRILARMLEARYPETRFKVINTAMTAINSHVILPIARDCASHQPDLFVIYMGNNEIVGPYGVSDVLGSHSSRLGVVRASIWVKQTRPGQLMSRLIESIGRSGGRPSQWQGMTMFVDRQLRMDDPRMASAYAQFAENLQDVIDVGRAAGAGIIVSTVGSNLKDCPPFASLPSPELSAGDATEWGRCYQEGARNESAQEYAAAIEHYQHAARIDDQRADLQFRLARCLLADGRAGEARRHFALARDRDVLRFRADTRINELIRDAARRREAEGVYLVDAVRAFEDASLDQLPGEALFYEHVHMNFSGNYHLALAVYRQLETVLPARIRRQGEPDAEPLSEAECAGRLLFTDWNRLTALTMLEMLYKQPPFVDQLYHQEREDRMKAEVGRLEEQLEAGGSERVMAGYRRALEQAGDDVALRQDFAVLLISRGEFQEAEYQLVELKKHLPYHPVPRVLLGQVFASQGRFQHAIAECDEALRLRPGWPQAVGLRNELRAATRRPY